MLKNIINHHTYFNKNQYGIYVPDLFATYGYLLSQRRCEELFDFILILYGNFVDGSIFLRIVRLFIFFLRVDFALRHLIDVGN
jgi:hypothetical protein